MRSLRQLTPGVLFTLLAASQFGPLTIWAANTAEIGFPDGLLSWIAVVTALAVVLWSVMVQLGADPRGTTYALFWTVFAGSTLGVRVDNVPGGPFTILIGMTLFSLAVYGLRDLGAMRWLQSWTVIVVGITPLGLALAGAMTTEAVSLPSEAVPIASADFRRHPDVVMVVFDAHASLDVLAETFSVDVAEDYQALFDAGTQVVSNMRSNYPLTHLSLASVLTMTYPFAEGDRIAEGEWNALLAVLGGDNSLLATFKREGYRYTVVESGWPGVHCTGSADACVRGVWPDEPTKLAIDRSVVGLWLDPLLGDTGPRGVVNSIAWLDSGLPALLANESRDLVLVHLMLPHPPLRLDGDCEYVHREGLGGRTIAAPYFTEDEIGRRVDAYIEAIDCARDVLTRLLVATRDDALVIAFGDHGSDSRAQLHRLPGDWSDDDIEERFGVLFATNSACPTDGLRSLVNVGTWLAGCLSDKPPAYQDDRFFIAIGSRRNAAADPEPLLEVTDRVPGN